MTTLRSYVYGEFVTGQAPLAELKDPATGETIAHLSSHGVDFRKAVAFARAQGGPALRGLAFAARGDLILAASKALQQARDELIQLAMISGGNTRGDAKFDVDGAIGTLAAYGELGRALGDTPCLRDGEGVQPTRSTKLFAEHLWFPRKGVALHINAFNFPAWGLCEKAAVAWLAGVPVLTKPATSTAQVACRIAELLAPVLPPGALSLIAGSIGDTLDHLGDQDVIAFTGSSDTARLLRGSAAVLDRGARLNVEADSLNVAVLGPDGTDERYDLFLQDVVRDLTQKAGQKCTAIRRIFVPKDRIDDIAADLVDRLGQVRVGNPHGPEGERVTMGPVATAAQLKAVREGIARLRDASGQAPLCGGPEPLEGPGYFVRPTLLRCDHPAAAAAAPIHQHEVFGPVATLMPYEDTEQLIDLVQRGGGGLVASIYSDDRAFVPAVTLGIGSHHGRVFLGSARLAGQSPGPGTVLPALNHGGPGHAGDGHELGGLRGLQLYMQRCAVVGYRPTVEALAAPH